MVPSDDTQSFLVLDLHRPVSGFLHVTRQIPSMCEMHNKASSLGDGVSSKLHHIPSLPATPPSQQTLTLFCDYCESSFPNVHQIKELLGHGRTCLWGRISFKVTAQLELTLLVFIQSMQVVPMQAMFIFLQQSLHSSGCSFLFLKVITAPTLQVNSGYALWLVGLGGLCHSEVKIMIRPASCHRFRKCPQTHVERKRGFPRRQPGPLVSSSFVTASLMGVLWLYLG